MRRLILPVSMILFCGCVTVPSDQAVRLADSGLQATSALRAQIKLVSDTTIRQTEIVAFQDTAFVCLEQPSFCGPQLPTDEVIGARDELAELFRLRLNAIEQLNKAYEAFKREAQYDASADLSGAVNDLVSSVNVYADAASAAAPGAGIAARLVGQVATNVSAVFAKRQQVQRLEQANVVIGEAASILSEALKAEQVVYLAFLADWSSRENEVRAILVQSGITSRSDALAPLANSIGAPLIKDAEKTIARSDLLKASIEAMILSQAHRRRIAAEGAYNAAAKGLDQLSIAHKRFSEFEPSDLDKINLALAELNSYADQIIELRSNSETETGG